MNRASSPSLVFEVGDDTVQIRCSTMADGDFHLDAPLMLSEDPVVGGLEYHPGGRITVPESPGIGAVPDDAFIMELEKVRLSC